MLGQLKDRIQSAQHDLSASIRDRLVISSNAKAEVRHRILGLSSVVPANSTHSSSAADLDVNLYAGADLIAYYQSQWQDLQQAGTENASLARQVSGEIHNLNGTVSTLQSSSSKLLAELTNLPEIEESLSAIEAEITKSLSLFSALEDAITELNQQVTAAEYEARKSESESKINDLILRRSEDIRLLESQYIVKEEAKLREKAEREASQLRERQAVFQAAFEEELRLYKEKGTVLPIETEERSEETKTENEPEIDQKLAEISLEMEAEEADALENFLQD